MSRHVGRYVLVLRARRAWLVGRTANWPAVVNWAYRDGRRVGVYWRIGDRALLTAWRRVR